MAIDMHMYMYIWLIIDIIIIIIIIIFLHSSWFAKLFPIFFRTATKLLVS
jgi:hypothetical protein